jgi:hypothetical protein
MEVLPRISRLEEDFDKGILVPFFILDCGGRVSRFDVTSGVPW